MSTTPSPSPTRITTAEQENVKALQYALGHALEESPTYMHGIARTLHSLGVVAAAPPVSDTAAPTITPAEYEQAYYAAAEVLRRIDVEPALAMNKFWYASRATDAVLAALGLTVTDKADQ